MRSVKAIYIGVMFLLMGCDGDNTPSIHKWQGVLKDTDTYSYIIQDPPTTQSGLVSLVINYIKNDPATPESFLNGEHGISFYKQSDSTPIDGKRPEASWWEQPLTDPAIKYKEIDEREIAVVNYLKGSNTFRVYLQWEYRKHCQVRNSGIVEVQVDGTIAPLCD